MSIQTPGAAPLLGRSKNWLKTNPTLEQVKQAVASIVSKVINGAIPDGADPRKTCDELSQYFVDRGGDLTELPQIPTQPTSTEAGPLAPTPVSPVAFDCSSLHPDVEPAAPLSLEERQRQLEIIKAALVRPGGF